MGRGCPGPGRSIPTVSARLWVPPTNIARVPSRAMAAGPAPRPARPHHASPTPPFFEPPGDVRQQHAGRGDTGTACSQGPAGAVRQWGGARPHAWRWHRASSARAPEGGRNMPHVRYPQPWPFGRVGHSLPPGTVLAPRFGASSRHRWKVAEGHLPPCFDHTASWASPCWLLTYPSSFESSSRCPPRGLLRSCQLPPSTMLLPMPSFPSPSPPEDPRRRPPGATQETAEPLFPRHRGLVAGWSWYLWLPGSSHVPQGSPTAPLWQHLPKPTATAATPTGSSSWQASMQRQVWLPPQGAQGIRPVSLTHRAGTELLLRPETSPGSASSRGTCRDQRGKSLLVSKHSCSLLSFLLKEPTLRRSAALPDGETPNPATHPCQKTGLHLVLWRTVKTFPKGAWGCSITPRLDKGHPSSPPSWFHQACLDATQVLTSPSFAIPGGGRGLCRPRGDAVSSLGLSSGKPEAAAPGTQQSSLNFGTDVRPVGKHGWKPPGGSCLPNWLY